MVSSEQQRGIVCARAPLSAAARAAAGAAACSACGDPRGERTGRRVLSPCAVLGAAGTSSLVSPDAQRRTHESGLTLRSGADGDRPKLNSLWE